VLHRDLKPENVMVGEFGEVLVMDWGLAKMMNDEGGAMKADAAVGGDAGSAFRLQTSSFQGTLQGSVMGTPQFMSPEQARGEIAALDERADVYSLGAILYAILTLRPPVEGRTLDEVLAKVARAQVTSPSDLPVSTLRKMARGKGGVPEVEQARPLPHIVGGRVPAALSLVAMKALALEKAKRYRHVADFSADIAAYQGGFATSAENAGFAKQAALLIKRHKGIFTTAAAAWLLVSALAVWFMWNLRAKERRAVAGEQHATKAEAVAVQERETARRALAKSQLDLAEKEFTRGKFVEAQKILGETPESFRDANWRFLSTHSQDFSAQLSIRGKGSTHRLQFLPGGDRFAVKCWAGVVGVFTITGEQVGDWIPASGGHSVPFGIDSAGDKIAVVASASEVAVVDVASAKLLRRWTCESNDLWHVLLSADGQTVLAVDRRQTFAYAAQTGALLWKTPSSLITPAISPDSRTVALVAVKSGLTLKVELRDLTTGEVRSSLEATADNPDKSVLQFNQAGDQLACFGGDEMILWNPKTAAKIRALHFPGEQVKALSPVGSLVATISGGRIGLWDAETGRLLRSLQGATTDVTELTFSRDAKTLLSSHVAANDGVVHVWPVRLREEIVSSHTVGTKGRRIAFGQDGSRFYACAGNAAEWETRGGREIWRFSSGEANLLDFALHPTDGSIVVSDFKKKVFAHVSPDRQAREDFGSSWDSGLGFNRSGQLLLVVDQAVAQINPGAAFSVVEYPSGKVLHKTSFPSEGRQPFAQFCLDDAAMATAALAGGITVWDWKAGKPLRQIAAAQTGSIACLASSPDGRHLASGGPDRWIRVWEAETGRLETAFRAHWEGVRSVRFSPDGREILSGSEDGTVRLHDAATGEERLAFSGHTTPVVDVNISNDGKLIGALTSDGFTKVWDRQRSSISPVLVNDTDNWEDLLAPLTPEIVNQTGHGWSMKDGELFCPDTKYAMLPLSANVSGTSYRVRVNLRQLPANEVFHIVLPVADRMCGFELEARPHGSVYSGVIMVNGKYGKDMPGVVEGKLVNDLATHALEVIVRLKGANVTISSTLDTRPLYTWTGPATALKQTRSWATTPHGELALGSFRLGWVVSAVKLKRE
jgi:WD40 repeat protein